MTVFDPTVSGLRQKDPELLGVLGNSWEGPGIVGDCWEGPGIVRKDFNYGRQAALVLARVARPLSHGLLDGWNVAVSGLRQKDPFTLY